jgi:hypothetical protein
MREASPNPSLCFLNPSSLRMDSSRNRVAANVRIGDAKQWSSALSITRISMAEIIVGDAVLSVDRDLLASKCGLFHTNPGLLASPYRVASPVSADVFAEFLAALRGSPVAATPALLELSREFGFQLPPALDSLILPDLPPLLSEFRSSRIALLWRGTRDGFGPREFHRRCDGHANTLTVIRDVGGNVFGGFTPVPWESRAWNGEDRDRDNRAKSDDSLKSFLFTLINPQKSPPAKFRLKTGRKGKAIQCWDCWGPCFGAVAHEEWGYPGDLAIADNCNAKKTNNNTYGFGNTYENPAPVKGKSAFTAQYTFTVQEIEVFEVVQ